MKRTLLKPQRRAQISVLAYQDEVLFLKTIYNDHFFCNEDLVACEYKPNMGTCTEYTWTTDWYTITMC